MGIGKKNRTYKSSKKQVKPFHGTLHTSCRQLAPKPIQLPRALLEKQGMGTPPEVEQEAVHSF